MYYISNSNSVKSGTSGITEHTMARITYRNDYLCKKRVDDVFCSFFLLDQVQHFTLPNIPLKWSSFSKFSESINLNHGRV